MVGTASQNSERPDNRVLEVEIAGVNLRLRSSHSESTVKEIVELVDRRVREALTSTKSGSVQAAAMLAALNLAEELMLLRRKSASTLDRLERGLTKAVRDLDEVQPRRTGEHAL